jgi:hypothetical protein
LSQRREWGYSDHIAKSLTYVILATPLLGGLKTNIDYIITEDTSMLSTWFTTQILPGIISAASGAVFGAVLAGWNTISERLLLAKVGPSVQTIYNILDPILDANITGWKNSDVNKVIGLVISIAADGKLTPDEVNKTIKVVSERWLPQIAVQKVADGLISDKEMVVAEKIRAAVETRTIDTPEFLKIIKDLYLS